MPLNESTIREITDPAEFAASAKVIRNSFKTVAEEFGLTRDNTPTHPAFLTVRWLREKKSDDVKYFGLFLVPQGHHKFDKRLACQSSGGTASRGIDY